VAIADDLVRILSEGALPGPALMEALGVSQPTLSRQLNALVKQGRVLRIGSTRGARYAMRREIPESGSSWPLYRVDEHGNAGQVGTLYALVADQYFFAASDATFAPSALTHGLPHFLQDQRPGGFLGRAVPQRYPELNLPQRVIDWTDDHYLRYFTRHGGEAVSNLILGDAAFSEYLASLRSRRPLDNKASEFPQLLRVAIEGGLPGSSAHGEHPKFTALVREEQGEGHVLVKFSPPLSNPIGRRWSDLLVAEHIAHVTLSDAGVLACRSRMHFFDNHAFLQVDRFDRSGADGRIGVTSLFAIDLARYRRLDNWIAAAGRLLADRIIEPATAERMRLLATFGAFIANTDRHFGNLAFYDSYNGKFTLAPVYDMLPMLFAPEHNQIIPREFVPPDPTAEALGSYAIAREIAERYWQAVIGDTRISDDFRAISAQCLMALRALPRSGPYSQRPTQGR
jgi:hypothetical protein